MMKISNTISKIYTYKNPFEIDKMSIWNDISKYPHLCVSQTLVEGLKEYYGREKFSVLCTVDSFLKKLYKEWHDSSENNIKQSIKISNILDKWQDNKLFSNEIINSIKHNKKEVIKAIKYLIESDVQINKIEDFGFLNEEQKIIFELYKLVKNEAEFKIIDINKNKAELKIYIEDCYADILEDELKKYIKDDKFQINEKDENIILNKIKEELVIIENRITNDYEKMKENPQNDNYKKSHIRECKKYQLIESVIKVFETYRKNKKLGMVQIEKVFLHGIHQFSPLILRMIFLLKEAGIEVIVLFNYMNEYSEIYKTWTSVYDWTNLKFIEEGNTYKDSRDIGKSFGEVFENKLSRINRKYDEKYYCFDNLTSFSDYVSIEYEKAVKKYDARFKNKETATNEKLMKIALMDEQFYAINGEEINELLKVYFPEQFSSRHFLTYPVGQFILSLYRMWDDENNKIIIKEEYMEEALSFNIWEKEGMPTPVDMFNNLKYYFRKISSLDEYLDYFKKIEIVSNKGNNENRKRLSFFIYKKEELEYFKVVLINIKKIAENIFSDPKDNIKNNFTKLMDNIKNLIINPSIDNKVSEEEMDMVKDIQKRLDVLEDTNEDTYIKNIKGVIGYYVESTTSENYEAEWIVRDFEQIDGGILLASAQKRDNNEQKNERIFHYAGLSDENILGKVRKELPWPLTPELYIQLNNNIANICATSRNEYDNFLKYSLFYGTYFLSDNKSIILSYINKLSDDEAHPYSILNNVMNIKSEDYKDDIKNNNNYKSNIYEGEKSAIVDYNISDSEKRSMETCFWRYLYNHCLDNDTFFFEEWQIDQISKYFIQYTYIENNGKYNSNKFKAYKKYLPIFDKTDYKEIIYGIDKKNGQKDTNNYINNRLEFIYRPMEKYKKSKEDVVESFKEELFGKNKIHFSEDRCKNCNQRTFCIEYINSLEED